MQQHHIYTAATDGMLARTIMEICEPAKNNLEKLLFCTATRISCHLPMTNNNNNNDRLTAFDPGQPG